MTTSHIPSVNADKQSIPANESSDQPWVDPIFEEKNPERLPDEIEMSEERAKADAAETAEMNARHRELTGEPEPEPDPDPDDLDEIVRDNTPATDGDGQNQQGDEGDDAEGDEEDDNTGDENEDEADADKQADGEDSGDDKKADAGKKPRRRRSRTRRSRRGVDQRLDNLAASVQSLTETVSKLVPAEEGAGEGEGEGEDDGEPPKLADFDYDNEKFSEALTEWTKRTIEKATSTPAAAEAEAADKKLRDTYNERVEQAREKYPDYDDVVNDPANVFTDFMADQIMESDVGPDMAYYLAEHRDEAMKIAGMTEIQAAKELGKIEARLSAAAPPAAGDDAAEGDDDDGGNSGEGDDADETAEQAHSSEQDADDNKSASQGRQPAKRQEATNAPEPPPSVSGNARPRRDPEKLSQDEYEEGRLNGTIK